MEKRYRLLLASRQVYREAELSESMQKLTVGTQVDADVRFPAREFFEPFDFVLRREGNAWQIECGGNMYASEGDSLKKMVVTVTPGKTVTLKYQTSGAVILTAHMRWDFDYLPKHYDRVIQLPASGGISLGGAANSQIRLPYEGTGDDRLRIDASADGYVLSVETEGLGTDLNGVHTGRGSVLLKPHDFISVGPYSFCIVDSRLYTDSSSDLIYNGVSYTDERDSKSCYAYPKFNRSTRIREVPDEEKIQILDPPAPIQAPRTNLVTQLLPAVGMLGVVLLTRVGGASGGLSYILMSTGSLGIGLVTSVLSIRNEKKKYAEDVAKRNDDYNHYIGEKRESIAALRSKEAQILGDTYYSVPKEVELVEGFLPQLFERQEGDGDFLDVRLGIGDREAVQKIEYKKQERIEPSDELQLMPEKVAEEFKLIHSVPVTVSLAGLSQIGVCGSRDALYHMLKVMTMDLAVRHYYTDVQLFYCIGDEDRLQFDWLRMLPHVQNEQLNRRNIICDDESRGILLEYLYKEISRRNKDSCSPRMVVFVYRDRGIQSHPVSELIKDGEEKGVTFIYFNEHEEMLPRSCGRVIRMADMLHGRSIDSADGTKSEEFTADTLSDATMYRTARKLAPVYCEQISLESTLTRNITFFELLHIYGPEDLDLGRNWARSEVYRSMAAPLGVNAKNQVVSLDLHEKFHGPHGLVAGTTGSGKSEILQSYILSMALRFHPYEVGFVIIDFKGGGMVNQFKNLPHLVGSITNIDGREIDRSLMSIRAELKKRQELFAQNNVNHIDAYIRLYRQKEVSVPLPHLILIVDEFAELKMEQPEFMKELISTARIGRSLGVHLILATQKPSGVVDPQIWSNSRFKLCLKVQSKEDSNEVLKNPLASEITEPGRAYLQVGNNEIFELFQSAYSGASAHTEGAAAKRKFVISRVDLAGKRTPVYEQKPVKSSETDETQLESVVSYVDRYCRDSGIERLPFICLPPLPELLPMDEGVSVMSAGTEDGLKAYVGIYDDPSNQYQGSLELNVTLNNTMIIGSAQNGKTNLLQTVIRSLTSQYTPEELNLYILDFGTMIFRNFGELHHVGGVVCAQEEEKLKNLFKMLEQETAERKERLSAAGVSSYASYLEAGFTGMPQIVVLIDNLTAMRELYMTENDFLLPLCREGIAVGITFIVANSQTSGIGFRYLSNFGSRIALCCNDSTEYNALFDSCRMRPYDTPGRCLIEKDKTIYEAQTYLAFEGEREVDRVGAILRFVQETNQTCPDQYARRIPVVPKDLTAAVMEKEFRSRSDGDSFALGVDFGQVEPVVLQWETQNILAVSGKAELGRETFVRYMVQTMVLGGAWLYVLDDMAGRLDRSLNGQASGLSSRDCTKLYSRSVSDTEELLADLEMTLEDRYRRMMTGPADFLKGEPLIAVLLQNREVIARISGDKTLLASYKGILSKYQGLKVCIVYTDLENAAIPFNAPEVLKMMKDNRQFVIFENIDAVKLADIPGTLQRQYKKPLEEGEAYLLRGNVLQKVKTVRPEAVKGD